MNCPKCNQRCGLREDQPQYYECKRCGVREMDNPAGPGTMWMQRGKIIAAPEHESQRLEQVKEAYPQIDFDKPEETL